MLIPLKEILTKYNLSPKGVIHCGAHFAEEHDDYVACGIERFVYIEPCKEAYDIMVTKLNSKYLNPLKGEARHENFLWYKNDGVCLFNVACGAEEKEMPMYVSHQNQGQSNSLLKPEGHLTQHPEIVFDDAEVVKVVTLDSLKVTGDLLVMDCQGYEGEVLKGGVDTIKQVSMIYTEVNRGQTHAGNMEVDEMDAFLAEYGFKRVETYWPSPTWTWGDAVYVKQ